MVTPEIITIGAKTTTARGRRYLTLEEFQRQAAAEQALTALNARLDVLEKDRA